MTDVEGGDEEEKEKHQTVTQKMILNAKTT